MIVQLIRQAVHGDAGGRFLLQHLDREGAGLLPVIHGDHLLARRVQHRGQAEQIGIGIPCALVRVHPDAQAGSVQHVAHVIHDLHRQAQHLGRFRHFHLEVAEQSLVIDLDAAGPGVLQAGGIEGEALRHHIAFPVGQFHPDAQARGIQHIAGFIFCFLRQGLHAHRLERGLRNVLLDDIDGADAVGAAVIEHQVIGPRLCGDAAEIDLDAVLALHSVHVEPLRQEGRIRPEAPFRIQGGQQMVHLYAHDQLPRRGIDHVRRGSGRYEKQQQQNKQR